MASHELRRLLALIDANAQRMIAMQGRLTAAELAERAQRIRGAVRTMTQLIDDLIASAESADVHGGVHYHPREVDLTAVLSEVCDLQRELTPHARIRVMATAQPFTVQGDATLLRQVFGNILSNAVRYSRQPAQVDVSVARENEVVMVSVADRGIGIPEPERRLVFERYYRGSNTAGVVGSGVGLHVVKTLVELHKGTVAVHEREGGGTRFEVRLGSASRAGAVS
jgi:signal transduction histidine kinase